MWELQGLLLYKSIERRNEIDRTSRMPEAFDPYADLLRDPRLDPEEAKKLAA